MSDPDKKQLSSDDRVLWTKVARSVRPLPGKSVDEGEVEDLDFAALFAPAASAMKEAPSAASPDPAPTPAVAMAMVAPAQAPGRPLIDTPTRRKLARGRLPIEGKVDLHGLTQSEAHSLLLSFLHRAYADGRRHVLVVTGKGSSLGSDGILRRAVPAWFATPPFRGLVGGHELAARHHGGAGAIYVRLRRQAGGAS